MAEKEIPFRQIHLDFHTSEAIEGSAQNLMRKSLPRLLRMRT